MMPGCKQEQYKEKNKPAGKAQVQQTWTCVLPQCQVLRAQPAARWGDCETRPGNSQSCRDSPGLEPEMALPSMAMCYHHQNSPLGLMALRKLKDIFFL